MTDLKKRPPSDRGQGRKPLAAGEETVSVSVRMPKGMKDKLVRLGGGAWMRDKIARAKDPAS